jgi:hypothetical protein
MENFSKFWPHKLQDYNIWNEGMSFFASCQTGSTDFGFILLKISSLLKVEVFYIIVVNWVKNPQKKIKKIKKSYFHFLKDFYVERGMWWEEKLSC